MFLYLKQLLCFHDKTILKRKPVANCPGIYRFYVECFDCGYESDGIDTGHQDKGTQTPAVV